MRRPPDCRPRPTRLRPLWPPRKGLRFAETLELEDAAIDERAAFHLADDGTHGLRDEHLPRLRDRADAGGEVDRAAEEVGSLSDRLAGVDADPNLDAGAALLAVGPPDGLLDCDGARHGGPRRLERDHERVALGLDHVAAIEGELLLQEGVVEPQRPVGGLVAVKVGEPADVAEEDGDGRAEGRGFGGVRFHGAQSIGIAPAFEGLDRRAAGHGLLS
jgi:hypothetical protein